MTRLDSIGLPVWQAVRPWSRALSVHQGKGWTREEAQLGALLEAVESDAAECFDTVACRSSFEALGREVRAPDLADFVRDRADVPDPAETTEWAAAERLDGRGQLFLPFAFVSLDFTRPEAAPFERSSNGIAIGATRDEAVRTALHELVERDSVRSWQECDLPERMASGLDLDTVGSDWLATLRTAIARAGADLRCYAVPSLTATPVFACEINDSAKAALPFRATGGRGCHPVPEIALFKAVAEAVQSRCAFIAGTRDDLGPWHYSAEERAVQVAFAPPPPPGMDLVDFRTIASGPESTAALVAALGQAGYPDSCAVLLRETEGFVAVRAFVAGLGSMTRARRVPS